YVAAPWVTFYNLTNPTLGYSYFYDYTSTPNGHLTLTVSVSAVSSTGFTLQWSRVTSSGFSVPLYFSMELILGVLG
ncbi:MAG TPA: hypothetical protein VFR31_05080, partial [Thermoanaerobaculia bacterium]|nr:hypothetical protein [Thermoanaerobaculia bacterium]